MGTSESRQQKLLKSARKFVSRREADGIVLTKVYDGDLHENFIDLNPGYAEMQRANAKLFGKKCVNTLGSRLVNRIKSQKREIFNKRFESGERLPYEEIIQLTDK